MSRGPVLRIVSVNDVYSLENLPRLKTLVREHTTPGAADAFIVVLAGDFVAPSLLSSIDAGRGMVACLNDVGVTHVIFGNHEDDLATEELHRRIAEFHGVWLSTNVRGFDPKLPTHQVIEVAARGGRTVRVGLAGIVMADATVYRRAPFAGGVVTPANPSALEETERLLGDERCAVVVPLTHQPIPADQELARARRAPAFPVIVGGHEHCPYVERIADTWIVKTGADAFEAAVIDLVFASEPPPAGQPDEPTTSVCLVPVAGYAEDVALREMVDALMMPVRELETSVLLTLAPGETLSSVGARLQETTLGEFVCSKLRDTLDAEACLFNGGGLRGSKTYAKHLTYGDIKTELPFDNEIVCVLMPGDVIRRAVLASRSLAPREFGGFLQVDDKTFVDRDIPSIAGAPLDPDRDYRVAIVRNLFEGMDRIEPLVRFASEHPDRVPPPGSGRECKVVLLEGLSMSLWKKLGKFESVDADQNGAVTEAELAAAVESATDEIASATAVGIVMRTIDTNRDRVITRDEADAANEGESG